MRESFVYFVEAVGIDRIKIGWTTNLEARLTDLQCGCPVPLEHCFSIPGGSDEEHELHHRFRHARTSGEWFVLSAIQDALLEIASAKSVALKVIGRCPDCGGAKAGRKYPKQTQSGRCRSCAFKAKQPRCEVCNEPGKRYTHHTKEAYCPVHLAEERERRAAVHRAKVSAAMAGNQNARRSARGKVLAAL